MYIEVGERAKLKLTTRIEQTTNPSKAIRDGFPKKVNKVKKENKTPDSKT